MEKILTMIFGNWWAVSLFCASILLISSEVGFRFGLKFNKPESVTHKEQISAVQAVVFGLLGLLLGFTFSMSIDRFDRRRELVIQEANAIGTTYLRSSFLPKSHQAPVKELLLRYVDVQLKYQPLVNIPIKRAEGIVLLEEIENKLWRHAAQAAEEAPNDITATFIESLNELIDTTNARVTAVTARIPGGVWLLLMIVASFGTITNGYSAGMGGTRITLNSIFLPLLVTAVISLIFDFSDPLQGQVSVSQKPLIKIQQYIKTSLN